MFYEVDVDARFIRHKYKTVTVEADSEEEAMELAAQKVEEMIESEADPDWDQIDDDEWFGEIGDTRVSGDVTDQANMVQAENEAGV